jgi:drug/metabolite transporter (DMT)-like permease
MPKPFVPPVFALFFGILAVSTGSIFVRYAQEYAPSLVIAAWRLSLATLMLMPIALSSRRRELLKLNRNQLGLALFSGFLLAIHFATWISSLEFTTVASSVVLVSTVPLWVALLSPFTLKEPVTHLAWIGMALSLLGGIVVGVSDACVLNDGQLICPSWRDIFQGKAILGDFLALTGAIAGAGYLIIGRNLRAKVSLVSYIFLVYGVSGLILIALMLLAGQVPFGYPAIAYLLFFLLALIPQLMGHSTFNWALGYLSAAYVSIALLGEPIGSTILAYVFLQEVPTFQKIFGAILILAGIYVASRGEIKK